MTLVLVAHGTREPAGAVTAERVAEAVSARLAGVPVALAYADVRRPSVAEVLAAVDGPATVVPAFLASGYHVRVDLPEQIARTQRRDVVLAAPLGPAPAVVAAVHDRLIAAGWRAGDELVLAAAGSSDNRALADVARAAELLAARTRRHVRLGFVTTARPDIDEAVAIAGAGGRRVAVASWLLAPGLFHRWVTRTGAAVVSEPIGPHPMLVEQVIRCYRQASGQVGRMPARVR